MTLDELRGLAVTRTLFRPGTLKQAFERLGYVQADPIRAPARAQDLILRHRVRGYRVGDLDRRYAQLDIEEDYFLNYGFVSRALAQRMHPRPDRTVPADGARAWPAERRRRAGLLLAFVRERGAVHPRDVDRHFDHGRVKNYWGGSSNATTQLLDAMHYIGLLRIARRERGVRIYASRDRATAIAAEGEIEGRLDALVDAVLRIHAPLPKKSLGFFLRRLRYAVPQWQRFITGAIQRARGRLAHGNVEGTEWYWLDEPRGARPVDDAVRLLAPFDPVVHDRTRFELLWGWTYRFEAYTPVAKRRLGYYAMPLLFRDRVIGWGNLAVEKGGLEVGLGYVGQRPREAAFKDGLDEEIERLRDFLRLGSEERSGVLGPRAGR